VFYIVLDLFKGGSGLLVIAEKPALTSPVEAHIQYPPFTILNGSLIYFHFCFFLVFARISTRNNETLRYTTPPVNNIYDPQILGYSEASAGC
jgi:hypothetical protein